MKRLLLTLFVLSLVAAGALLYFLATPYAGFSNEVFIDIPHGTGTQEIGKQLAAAGVIRAEWHFLLARLVRRHATLQAGEYRFAGPATVWDVYNRIARGDVFYYELQVPEGNNLFDIASSVAALGVIPALEFLKAARNAASIRDLDPDAPTLEGYLFPSTYRVTRHTTADQLCRMMTEQFRRVWKELNAAGREVHATVTLASLVEKETAVAGERPRVASVYLNRLEQGMPLQCDPTTIYAALLENRYRGAIHRSDLDRENRYNTYRHAGLPPGPIANPGRKSLEAVLKPESTDYLYFVARPGGSGAHEFSRDLKAHEAAVQRYRHAGR